MQNTGSFRRRQYSQYGRPIWNTLKLLSKKNMIIISHISIESLNDIPGDMKEVYNCKAI